MQLTIAVEYEDGRSSTYVTKPIDLVRAERISGKPVTDFGNMTAISALAYSCAMRTGEAYKTRSAKSDERAQFEAWLEGIANLELADTDPTTGGDSPES